MRGFAEYATACVLSIAIIGAIAWTFSNPAGQQLVLISAGLAFAVQLLAFGVARLLQRRQQLMLGWGIGGVLRLLALVTYALVVARLWRGAVAPALLSLAAFLFVTTVVEPIFLRR